MGFERDVKRRLIRFLTPLFPDRRGDGKLRRVLFIRVDDRLGNVLMLSPAIDWIHRTRPEIEIGLVIGKTFASIYGADPRIRRSIVLDKDAQKAFFPIFLRDLARVGSIRADGVIECSDRNAFSFNSALYARASRAPRRVGFENDQSIHYLTDPVSPPETKHAARDPLCLAAALLGVPPSKDCRLSLRLPAPGDVWKSTLDRLSKGAEDRIVGLHVGGRGDKRWPIERFVGVAAALAAEGWRPWVFRGPMEEDVAPLFEPLRAGGLVLVPRADVVETAHALARCRLVIAPDTGPMHLASAVAPRTLALFTNSEAERYHPLGPDDRWIDARGDELTVERVIGEAVRMLGSRGMEAIR
jgi:ADP-heptose:LPS heptosyltransferase